MIILTMYLQVLLQLQAARLHLQGTVQQPCLQAVCGGALGKGKTETVLGEASAGQAEKKQGPKEAMVCT